MQRSGGIKAATRDVLYTVGGANSFADRRAGELCALCIRKSRRKHYAVYDLTSDW